MHLPTARPPVLSASRVATATPVRAKTIPLVWTLPWLLLAILAAPARAADIGIASFNLAWLGTEADFAQHGAVCGAPAVNWCDSRPRTLRGASAPTPEEAARAKQCQADFNHAAGGEAAAMMVAPCNAYRMNAQRWAAGGPAQYAEKLAGLRQTLDMLITQQQVQVIAVQELKSADALRAILGTHAADFDTCVAAHNAFQTIGFAWRKGLGSAPGVCTSEPGLAVAEAPQDPSNRRSLRPGLALRLNVGVGVGGTPVTFMNLHLKSSCANLISTERFPGHELTDDDPACQILNRQVAPLERWVESVAAQTPLFVLMGDFNRRLDEEAAQNIPPQQVRQDGSDPASPHRMGSDGRVNSRYLWQELSDGQPGLVQVPLSDTATGCTGFNGLDHILISEALRARQTQALASTKLPVVQAPQQAIISSDHCPRVMRLAL